MDDGMSATRACRVCGAPIRVNNTYGICTDVQKPECQKIRERERGERRHGVTPERQCKVCGGPLRFDNTTGICSGTNSTPDCNRERKNLERTALGLPPYEPAKDVTMVRAGDAFGSWTVLEDGRGVVNYVLCLCECGAERPVTIARLTEGRSASCGADCEARRAAHPYLPPGTYGHLEVLEAGLRSVDLVRVHCKRCGNDTTKQAFLIKRGISASCGCGKGKFTHGLSRHPLYGTWNGMLDRCTNPKAAGYDGYGGNGVTVCAGWRSAPEGLLAFIADMGERPDGMTLDRRDVEGGYWCGHCAECVSRGRPFNCRWATVEQQARNKRSVVELTNRLHAALAALGDRDGAQPPVPRKRRPPVAVADQGALF